MKRKIDRYRQFFVCVLLCLVGIPAYLNGGGAPNTRFKRFSLEQGFFHNRVQCIIQDRHGFMWFGARGGLNKYDGYEFKTYKHQPGNDAGLSSDSIICIYETPYGKLWVGTDDGLNIFDPGTETSTRFKHIPGDPRSLSNNTVWCIQPDASGALWIGTRNGLNKYTGENNGMVQTAFERYFPDGENGKNNILDICRDHSGMLWLATNSGLYTFDPKTTVCRPYRSTKKTGRDKWLRRMIWAVHEDSKHPGTVWVGSSTGLMKLDAPAGTFRHYPLGKNLQSDHRRSLVNCIMQSRTGECSGSAPTGWAWIRLTVREKNSSITVTTPKTHGH